MELNTIIKKAIQSKQLSNAHLAELLGVSATTISNWKTGHSEPSISNLRKLADILDLDLSISFKEKEIEIDKSTKVISLKSAGIEVDIKLQISPDGELLID
ncbi:helix-turn-helix transcriptional regulator [Persicobacter diffluens]|uniref:HTH cro/C1-type domain-containing protein n=1 Tax=Persicobacter diffluens TaxID=981 RepID=A0AAN5AMP8_9BACT|nr:hypothetical protein PEDI_52260 [Persicobacter diffluens]GJM64782.1 hypothetical protein PEDI_53340 [Persicobacter diffluens]